RRLPLLRPRPPLPPRLRDGLEERPPRRADAAGGLRGVPPPRRHQDAHAPCRRRAGPPRPRPPRVAHLAPPGCTKWTSRRLARDDAGDPREEVAEARGVQG